MGSTSGMDRNQLVGELQRARDELRASYQGLPDEQMTRLGAVGEWSVKDVLSHVASWEEILLPDLARLARGDIPILAGMDLEAANFDPFNAMIMSLRRNLPLGQVLRELDVDRADLIEAVGRLPDSALAQGQFARFLLEITAAHDREHAEDIRQWQRNEGL